MTGRSVARSAVWTRALYGTGDYFTPSSVFESADWSYFPCAARKREATCSRGPGLALRAILGRIPDYLSLVSYCRLAAANQVLLLSQMRQIPWV